MAMATLGLLGGTSWESTILYYRHINTSVRHHLGGFHSAPILLHSVDFADFERLQREKNWAEAARRFSDAARGLVAAGAEAIMLCNNTFHVVADEIAAANEETPFIHIVDATAERIKEQGLRKVVLLGTRSTMEGTFFQEGMRKHGVEAVVPGKEGRDEVHRVVFEELVQGVVKESSREAYVRIVNSLAQETGAQGLIMGCTEIGMLVGEEDLGMPIFDTSKIHAEKAVDWAIAHGTAGKAK